MDGIQSNSVILTIPPTFHYNSSTLQVDSHCTDWPVVKSIVIQSPVATLCHSARIYFRTVFGIAAPSAALPSSIDSKRNGCLIIISTAAELKFQKEVSIVLTLAGMHIECDVLVAPAAIGIKTYFLGGIDRSIVSIFFVAPL